MLCDGKVSELQVQKVSLNTLSKLKTCKSPTCTGIGTRAHTGDQNPFPSSEMTYKVSYKISEIFSALSEACISEEE